MSISLRSFAFLTLTILLSTGSLAFAQSPTTLAHALVERLPPTKTETPSTPEKEIISRLPEKIETPSGQTASSSPPTEELAEENTDPLPHTTAPAWYSPLTSWFFQPKTSGGKKDWQRSVELGIDGSDGNSNTFNIRFGLDLKHQTKLHKFKLDLDYYKAESNEKETANQTFLDCRYERQLRQSRLNWFLNGNIEHDEFKVYDLRLTLNTGTGYRFIQTEKSTLTVRFGAGASHEIGGPEEVYVPELVYGVELDHQINDRQKISFSCDYFPDICDFRRYRLDSKASWEGTAGRRNELKPQVQHPRPIRRHGFRNPPQRLGLFGRIALEVLENHNDETSSKSTQTTSTARPSLLLTYPITASAQIVPQTPGSTGQSTREIPPRRPRQADDRNLG